MPDSGSALDRGPVARLSLCSPPWACGFIQRTFDVLGILCSLENEAVLMVYGGCLGVLSVVTRVVGGENVSVVCVRCVNRCVRSTLDVAVGLCFCLGVVGARERGLLVASS